MAKFLGRIIRGLFTTRPEEVVTAEDLQRDMHNILQEDKELSRLVALLVHQEANISKINS